MTDKEAVQAALRARDAQGIPKTFVPSKAEKRIVEIVADGQAVERKLPAPGPTRDLVAWVVTLNDREFWYELTLDDASGQLVRARQSRGVAELSQGATP